MADLNVESIVRQCGKQLGYDSLKKKQVEDVIAFIEGNDVFVCLSTGYGKSVIYALLPSVFDTLRGRVN